LHGHSGPCGMPRTAAAPPRAAPSPGTCAKSTTSTNGPLGRTDVDNLTCLKDEDDERDADDPEQPHQRGYQVAREAPSRSPKHEKKSGTRRTSSPVRGRPRRRARRLVARSRLP
jgi:hypothetical protein